MEMTRIVETYPLYVPKLFAEDKTFFWKSWVEEGVDTVGDGVLLLFRGQDFFGYLWWRRVFTQLVTGC